MGALLILFLFALYVWLAYKVVRRAGHILGKALLVLTFILIPTADAIYGRVRLKQMCDSDGGTRIHKVIKGVNGFYAQRNEDLYWMTKYGYQYVESGSAGEFVRASLDPTGKVIRGQRIERLESLYAFETVEDNKSTYLVQKFIVKDLRTQEILGTSTDIAFYGGWAERSLNALYSHRQRVGHCDVTDLIGDRISRLITSVLIPTK